MIRLAFLAPLALIAACSGRPTPEESLRQGVAALEAGQPRTARVAFMNLLQDEPGNGEARLLQARALLALDEGVAAESEILRAREAGVPRGESAHLLAHAMLLQGRAAEALAETGFAAPGHSAHAARMAARAHLALGDEEAADAAFARALSFGEADPALWADIARRHRARGDMAGALAAADRAVAAGPRDTEALVLRGELTRAQYGLHAALAWFDRALEVDPLNVPALLERAITYGDLGWMKAMLADSRRALSLAPGHPLPYHLQAVLAARAGDFDLARTLHERTGGAYDGRPAGMLLAAAIAMQTGKPDAAAARLETLVAAQPDNRRARRMLAAARWRAGDAEGTAAALRPLVDRADADAYALTLMGRALERLGDRAGAAHFLARAARPHERWATALSAGPVDDAALEALRRDAAARPGDAGAEIALVAALLGRGAGGEALARAVRLRDAYPGVPDAHMLVGDARGIGGDFAGAAEEYRRAANLAFTEPVAMRLIEALSRSGQGEAAEQALHLFLQQNPRNVAALMLAGDRHMRAADWEGAAAIYERLLHRLGSRDATVLNNLAWAYAEMGDHGRALPLARRAWDLDPANPMTTDTLGWILFKSGHDRARGLALMERAARGAPDDAEMRHRLERARRG